jgi:hypothetical protein
LFPDLSVDSAGHLIQVALAPVFLLSGIAALMNVFAGRLARVADQFDALSRAIGAGTASAEQNTALARLHRRSVSLDVAVVLATAAAAATCLAILTLFLFAVANKAIALILLIFFGLAIILTLGSVAAFGLEMLMSSRAVRERIFFHLPLALWRPRKRTT